MAQFPHLPIPVAHRGRVRSHRRRTGQCHQSSDQMDKHEVPTTTEVIVGRSRWSNVFSQDR